MASKGVCVRRQIIAVLLFAACFLALAAMPAEAAKPRTLVFGRSADATFLDPAKFLDNESAMVIENIFDGLVRYADDSTRIEPALAESWSVSPDGLAYTFKLRRGVSFHDGTPFNAEAAQFSLARKTDPAHPFHRRQFSKMDTTLASVLRVQAVGDYTLRITLKEPQPGLLDALARHSCYIVSPAAVRRYGDGFDHHPVGTGPFVFESWLPGDRIILSANRSYFAGAPKIDTLVFKVVPDARVRLLELKAGSIQAMDSPGPELLAELRRNPALVLDARPGMNVGYLAMNTGRPPLDNPLVRRAIAHAVNRKTLLSLGYKGMAVQARTLVPPGMRGASAKARDYAFDPAQARKLLRQAGLPDGFETTLWAMPVTRPYMPEPSLIARLIQENLAAVGIRAHIVTHDWAKHLAGAYNGEHDLCLLGWVSTGDAGDILGHLLDSDSAVKPHASNVSFFRNKEVHELLARAAAERDPVRRDGLFERVQAVAQEQMPVLPLAHAQQVLARRQGVTGIVNHQTGVVRFARAVLP
jgi:peptide/nickel transport system substrate-binding protein